MEDAVKSSRGVCQRKKGFLFVEVQNMNHCRPQIPITEGVLPLFLFVSLLVINSPKGAFYDQAYTYTFGVNLGLVHLN